MTGFDRCNTTQKLTPYKHYKSLSRDELTPVWNLHTVPHLCKHAPSSMTDKAVCISWQRPAYTLAVGTIEWPQLDLRVTFLDDPCCWHSRWQVIDTLSPWSTWVSLRRNGGPECLPTFAVNCRGLISVNPKIILQSTGWFFLSHISYNKTLVLILQFAPWSWPKGIHSDIPCLHLWTPTGSLRKTGNSQYSMIPPWMCTFHSEHMYRNFWAWQKFVSEVLETSKHNFYLSS